MIGLKILRHGFDGKKCLVHGRIAAHGEQRLITAQFLDVTGSDLFEPPLSSFSTDGGKTWTDFRKEPNLESDDRDGLRCVCCDMTPMYHRASGKFLVSGHLAQYQKDGKLPVQSDQVPTKIPYAVFNTEKRRFEPVQFLIMPEREQYFYCGSGCSQCWEEPDGTILMPISYISRNNGKLEEKSGARILRLAFDGEQMSLLSVSNDLRRDDDVRGIGETSVIAFRGRYYLTIRGDSYGYFSVSDDGNTFSQPEIWRWEDGEIVPTYNTQSHWMILNDELYLVYTRKNGKNDHVFRHRAPLYAAKVNTDSMTLVRDSEFSVVPERGARLGNFGVCTDENTAFVSACEWMQPEGCERYGSDNALFLAEIR